jgi:hypothetical protein
MTKEDGSDLVHLTLTNHVIEQAIRRIGRTIRSSKNAPARFVSDLPSKEYDAVSEFLLDAVARATHTEYVSNNPDHHDSIYRQFVHKGMRYILVLQDRGEECRLVTVISNGFISAGSRKGRKKRPARRGVRRRGK